MVNEWFLAYLGLGAVVGLFAGLLGIGGGLIIVPSLLYLLMNKLSVPIDLAMPAAIATSLSTIVFTGLSSSLAHIKLGHVKMSIVLWCGLGIAVGAILGPQIATYLPGEKLKAVFAILVLAIAAQMIFVKPRKSEQHISKPILLTIGVLTGIISAFMGIGGGALLVPALVWFRVDIKQAIGCAATCGMVIALFGTASFVYAGWNISGLPEGALGYVYLPAAVGIVMTSVFTAKLGAKISHKLNTQRLKQIFALFLVLVSLNMLLG